MSESTGGVPAWADSGWVKIIESVYDRFSFDPEIPTSTVRSSSSFVATSVGVGLRAVESGHCLDSTRPIGVSTLHASLVPVDAVPARDIPLGSLIVAGIGVGIMIGGIIATSPGWALAGLAILALGAIACGENIPAGTVPQPPLFQGVPICEDPIIPVTISTAMEVDEEGKITFPDRQSSEWMEEPATIAFCKGEGAEETFPIAFRLRGHLRRSSCNVPPGKIKFLEEMPWFMEGARKTLKLVYECDEMGRDETDADRDQITLSEHLMYEVVHVLGVETLFTRLGRFTLIGRKTQILEGLGFFLEHPKDFADRLGAQRIELKEAGQHRMVRGRIRIDDSVAVILANRLIDNFDFDLYQNLILLEYPDGHIGVAPYDLNASSLVDCPSLSSDSPSCAGVGSYDETYRKTRDWIQETLLNYDGRYQGHWLEEISPEEMRMAFARVAREMLPHRDAVIEITNHELLDPRWVETMRVQFSAFFDALTDTIGEISQ